MLVFEKKQFNKTNFIEFNEHDFLLPPPCLFTWQKGQVIGSS